VTSGIVDDKEGFVYPPMIRLTRTSLTDVNWALLDDGFNLYLYILK